MTRGYVLYLGILAAVGGLRQTADLPEGVSDVDDVLSVSSLPAFMDKEDADEARQEADEEGIPRDAKEKEASVKEALAEPPGVLNMKRGPSVCDPPCENHHGVCNAGRCFCRDPFEGPTCRLKRKSQPRYEVKFSIACMLGLFCIIVGVVVGYIANKILAYIHGDPITGNRNDKFVKGGSRGLGSARPRETWRPHKNLTQPLQIRMTPSHTPGKTEWVPSLQPSPWMMAEAQKQLERSESKKAKPDRNKELFDAIVIEGAVEGGDVVIAPPAVGTTADCLEPGLPDEALIPGHSSKV